MSKKPYQYIPMSTRVINQQIAAMRFLASLGLSAEEIRTFPARNVDLLYRKLTIELPVVKTLYNEEFGLIYHKVENREVTFRPPHNLEWFFFKMKVPSFFWVFMKLHPKRNEWRKEQQVHLLYSLEDVESFIRGVEKLPDKSINLLTQSS